MSDNLFENLARSRQKGGKDRQQQPQPEPDNQISDEPLKRTSRAKGKRSDPNFKQVGAYIPKDLDKAVKRKLLDEDLDFSDLVTQLLTEWVNRSTD